MSRPGRFTPVTFVGEIRWAPGRLWAGMEKRKSLASMGLEPWTVQPVANRYNHYANPVTS